MSSRSFEVIRGYYGRGDIYESDVATFNTGITVLCGCNGSGKTTLLRQIDRALSSSDVHHVFYNSLQAVADAREIALQQGDHSFLATLIQSSEGENISLNVAKLARKIGEYFRKHSDIMEFWLLIDSVDSGLDIEAICNVVEFFKQFICWEGKSTDIYIVVSTNAFEFANGNPCMDIHTLKYRSFDGYEDYKDFILKSAKKRDKRYSNQDQGS